MFPNHTCGEGSALRVHLSSLCISTNENVWAAAVHQMANRWRDNAIEHMTK